MSSSPRWLDALPADQQQHSSFCAVQNHGRKLHLDKGHGDGLICLMIVEPSLTLTAFCHSTTWACLHAVQADGGTWLPINLHDAGNARRYPSTKKSFCCSENTALCRRKFYFRALANWTAVWFECFVNNLISEATFKLDRRSSMR